MKETGIEWIGEIPRYWKVKRLKYFSDFLNGYSFDSNSLTKDYKYPVIRIGDIQNDKIVEQPDLGVMDNDGIERYKILKNDILIAMSGATVGKLGISDKDLDAYINQRVGIIRGDNYKFIFYSLLNRSFLNYIYINAEGSAQPNISMGKILDFSIPTPPLSEQKAIADFLDKKTKNIDNIKETLTKQIEVLKNYKKSLIYEATTKGLNKDVKLKDSGVEWFGKIPEHWKTNRIKYIFDVSRGEVISKLDLVENGKYPVYSSQTENDGVLGYLDTYKYFGEALTWTTDGYAGNIFYRNGKYNCTNVCGILKTKENFKDKIDIKFFNYIIGVATSESRRKDINGYKIMSNEMAVIPVTYPPLSEQKSIADFLDKKTSSIDKIIESKQQQIEDIENYKKSLIYEYTTGKKRIENK